MQEEDREFNNGSQQYRYNSLTQKHLHQNHNQNHQKKYFYKEHFVLNHVYFIYYGCNNLKQSIVQYAY